MWKKKILTEQHKSYKVKDIQSDFGNIWLTSLT